MDKKKCSLVVVGNQRARSQKPGDRNSIEHSLPLCNTAMPSFLHHRVKSTHTDKETIQRMPLPEIAHVAIADGIGQIDVTLQGGMGQHCTDMSTQNTEQY